MNIGIFTYGTRGDLQPYVALALGLMDKGHKVTLSATEDFKDFVEGFGVAFQPLWGNAETMMNSKEGQSILQTENSIKLMQYYFKVLHDNREPLRKSYYEAISKVDFIIANSMTLPIVSAIAEKQNKKVALTYFMPPVVPTTEFPLADFDFLNFPWYNKLTYKIAQSFFWKFIKQDTNEYRKELGLPELKENLITYLDKQKILDLYCLSQSLISQPKDWESHHKITGFINIPKHKRETHFLDQTTSKLSEWLSNGDKPIYIGFGSNGVGNTEKFSKLLTQVLEKTNERILFCTGWSQFDDLPKHDNLFVTKYVNHEMILPQCKLGVFHGGAGTLATMLRHNLPVIIVSFYTDQPTWGKIIERKKLGVHIPVKTLSADKLISAIQKAQTKEIEKNVSIVGQLIRNENGLDNAIIEIEKFFNETKKYGT
ncbi:glycosyltransferase family 1 protein [Flavobacterium sp. CYK-4]|uniref:glycosyltransferase n=1 Tax=Flavobacterium lotistagni TaxID=2709660 RepID=UPI00140E2E9C|nr:glycosyltransferase [Flavobacterium lotistagni]NHM07503.1 glycosyltransferase family 1 protein [Flavobacterium lotistagni]